MGWNFDLFPHFFNIWVSCKQLSWTKTQLGTWKCYYTRSMQWANDQPQIINYLDFIIFMLNSHIMWVTKRVCGTSHQQFLIWNCEKVPKKKDIVLAVFFPSLQEFLDCSLFLYCILYLKKKKKKNAPVVKINWYCESKLCKFTLMTWERSANVCTFSLKIKISKNGWKL